MDVSGWDASYGSVECPTISWSISYDHPTSGKIYMLVYHQAIHCPRLTSYLMSPIQSWMAGVRINDLPKFLAEEPDENTQPIIVDDPLNHNEPLVTPLALKVVTSYLPSRKPRVSEYEDESIPHIDITIKEPVWDLSETIFSEQEDTMTDFRGEVINNETITRGRRIINSLSTSKYHAVDFTDDKYLYTALNTKVNVAKFGGYNGKHGVTLESLSQKWIISFEADRRYITRTM